MKSCISPIHVMTFELNWDELGARPGYKPKVSHYLINTTTLNRSSQWGLLELHNWKVINS